MYAALACPSLSTAPNSCQIITTLLQLSLQELHIIKLSMATATKSSKSKIKKVVGRTDTPSEEAEHEPEIALSKSSKPIEIDEPEAVAAVDEKLEEDPLAAATEEDDSAEEISLDSEEVNPFGDRWEE